MEYEGPRTIALCSKCYFAGGKKKKISCKGVSNAQIFVMNIVRFCFQMTRIVRFVGGVIILSGSALTE